MLFSKTQTTYTHEDRLIRDKITYWFLFLPIYSVTIVVKSGASGSVA